MFKAIKLSARLFILTAALLPSGGFLASFDSGSRAAPAQTDPVNTIHRLPLMTNDLVYDPATQLIYASVPGRAGAGGNSITPINPAQSTTGTPVFVGSEPGRMALTGDGQVIYVGLSGAGAVRRFNVVTQMPDRPFYLGTDPIFGGPYVAGDIAVMPGSTETVAVARRRPCCSPDTGGVAVYDGGVQRPAVVGVDTSTQASNSIEFSASPTVLYGAGDGHPDGDARHQPLS